MPAGSAPVRVFVLAGNGTNCEAETAHAWKLAGADVADIVPIWEWAAGRASLDGYEVLVLPGGFMDGDDLGSARACAHRMRCTRPRPGGPTMLEEIVAFVRRGGLVLGICNGFQLLVKVGLLPGGADDPRPVTTLGPNVRGRFEDRWVRLLPDAASPCVFTKGLSEFELPVRHGEGRLLFVDDAVRQATVERHLVPLRYSLSGLPTDRYPFNPNGSEDNAAALCDATGRIFGLMPHPEAFVTRTQHPRWTREPRDLLPEEGAGLRLFRNAVEALRGA
ncbi:MAG: phosphoribosylformylglycinamidine synthase subunit PurQ [Deltaproteobacteria bacterium]|nr:phosphoribosylformylglycinamidine synthase subunit PurQ [Deltaproteobacteria bacterium]